jgi:3-hydroxyanthranilate 3,4-dioxygenase
MSGGYKIATHHPQVPLAAGSGPGLPSIQLLKRAPQEFQSMSKMPIISLPDTARELGASGKRVNVFWQHTDSLVFMARGREYRSEFHINPSDEMMYPVKGDLKLHYRTEDGKEEIAEVPEGSVIYTPAGTPHSPRFAPDAYLLVIERQRREGEVDRFQWYCPKCDTLLHEERFVVSD